LVTPVNARLADFDHSGAEKESLAGLAQPLPYGAE